LRHWREQSGGQIAPVVDVRSETEPGEIVGAEPRAKAQPVKGEAERQGAIQ